MQKKILINAGMITEKPTGVGVYNIQLLKHLLPKLNKQNISYVIYCYQPELIKDIASKNLIKKISLGFLLDKIFLKFQSVHRILWNLFLLNNIAHDYELVYALATYGSVKNQKQIITVHDLIALQFPRQHKFQYLYFKYIVPQILGNCRKVVAISDFTSTEIITRYPKIKPEKIAVIKNGIDHIVDKSDQTSDHYVDTITNHKPFCLMVGASYYHKNAEALLQVATLLKDDDINFVIAGSPSAYYNKLIEQAENLQLKNVFFTGYVTQATLNSLYKKADLHIYISLHEGFGFPPAEAAFYGTKSIISNHPALLEIYGEVFPSVNPKDENAIANLIAQKSYLTKDYKVYNHLQTLYNWETAANHIYNLLIRNTTNS